MSGNRLVLFGASGYTGSLTAPVLAQHGFEVVLAGRDGVRLEAMRRLPGLEHCEIIVADPLQPKSLAALFENHPILLVNCVGPFTLYGEAVVKAALKAGVHYLDITGEQEYMARVINRYHALAQEKQVAIIPGCGVEYALGNWAATLAANGLEPLDTISVANAVALKGRGISSGSTLSLLEVLRKPGLAWQDYQTQIKLIASEGRSFRFPAPLGVRRALIAPFGENLTLPRHIKCNNVKTYMAVGSGTYWLSRISFLLLPFFGELIRVIVRPFVKKGGPDLQQREASRWSVVAEAVGRKGARRVALSGVDMYGLTAQIIAYCASQILSGEFPGKSGGVLGAAQAFEARAALDYLATNCGVKVEVE
ncbi:MAG: saccharopine dehydrogenase NADP-binding domain-containing protein [Chloroflexi bacterium]|uniref:Saccharopine dehydrogenase NADP-binding domain-containing protein n=1 Tax=Candidatus Chlorohelix allophototropha TaxID=3003348 RepID=A0A8T7LW92_9CHLR|nr:saccharopine dehydrogenase NADP-binding domain-containing protein [Chloroflexota bacterium]WJW66355.1 saccharopine dehydrogenase NADP-binding domain-containing protein [Chloroflexota bacterium L227-S17]